MGKHLRDIGIGACVMATALVLLMFVNSWIKYEQDHYDRYLRQVELLRQEIKSMRPVVVVTDVPNAWADPEKAADLIPKQNLPVTGKEK